MISALLPRPAPLRLAALVLVGVLGRTAWRAQETRLDDGRTSRLEDLGASTCVPCHGTLAEEWRESSHATAWVDERYQRALAQVRRPESCTGCHAPQPLALRPGRRPAARDEQRGLGVHCATCHLAEDGETVLGPLGLETLAHPTRQVERFALEGASATCLPCHSTTIGPVIGVGKDFVASDQEGLGLTCVSCHMPVVRRALASVPEGSPGAGQPTPERRGRSHRILGPRDPSFLREAFGLTLRRTATGAVVRIENRAGHRVPGLKERRFRFEARLLDGSAEGLDQARLVIDSRAYLPVGEALELSLSGEHARAVELVGTHEAPGLERPFAFVERVLELD